MWRQVDVLDLSCQSCELLQVLRVARRACPDVSSYEEAAAWLLQHLPRDTAGIRAMGKSLRCGRQRVPGRGNGRDLQSGAAVASDWLRRRSTGAAPASAEAAGQASEVLAGFLPPSRCEVCQAALHWPFHGSRSCAVCERGRRRQYQREYRQTRPVKRRRRGA